jgi:protocatechuate 3,4-dioxygenase beta subunit
MPAQFTLLSCLVGFLLAVAAPAQRLAETAAEMGPIRVTVLDPNGKPKRGVLVELLRFDGADVNYRNLDLSEGDLFQTIAKLPTPKSGSLGMQVPVAIPYRVRVDVPPHAIEWREGVYAGAELTIQLRAGAIVEGTVKSDNGKPIRAEKVTLRPMPYPSRIRYHTQAGDNGRFRFERVMPCEASINVESTQGAIHDRHSVTLESGKVSTVNVTLDHGATMRGQVIDAATRKPIEGAQIGVGWTYDKPIRTDKDGFYELVGLGGPYANDLFIQAKGFCKQRIRRPGIKKGGVTVDLRLKRGLAVTGRILDVDGKPVEGCYVAAIGYVQGFDWRSARTDKDGRYTIPDLRHEIVSVLLVRDDLHATWTMPFPESGNRAQVTASDVRLRARRIIRGTLLDSMGKPWAGQGVELKGNHDGAPASALLASYLASRSVKTDTLGRFFFGDLAPGTYELSCKGDTEVIEVRKGKDPQPLDLR